MITPMRLYRSLFFFIALTDSVWAQELKPVADRVAAQNALFEEQYESDLRNFPQRATAFGDYRYNDKLTDYSLAGIAQRHETDQIFLRRLQAIDTTGFSDQDQLSHDVLVRVLQQRLVDFDLKEYENSGQPAKWHSHQSRRATAGRSPRLREALRRLHRPPSPNSPRPQRDHRSPARRNEG